MEKKQKKQKKQKNTYVGNKLIRRLLSDRIRVRKIFRILKATFNGVKKEFKKFFILIKQFEKMPCIN